VNVEGSNPFARSNFFFGPSPLCTCSDCSCLPLLSRSRWPGLPNQSGDLDAFETWQQGGNEGLALVVEDFRCGHRQGANEMSRVVIHPKAQWICGMIDAGLRIRPVALRAEQVKVARLRSTTNGHSADPGPVPARPPRATRREALQVRKSMEVRA
jgi:hypothetical protein